MNEIALNFVAMFVATTAMFKANDSQKTQRFDATTATEGLTTRTPRVICIDGWLIVWLAV